VALGTPWPRIQVNDLRYGPRVRSRVIRCNVSQGCAPLFRSAITFAARRALAAGIRRSTCTAAEARFAERTDRLARPRDPARWASIAHPVDPAPAEQ
jgi:hypothetical protein